MDLFAQQLPSGVKAAVPLPGKDKILSFAPLTDDAWIVATRTAVCVVGPDGAVVRLCRPWHEVDIAGYDPETRDLKVTWVDDDEPQHFTVTDHKRSIRFLQTLYERVQASVVLAEKIDLGDGRAVRVAVRKNEVGELFSQVVADAGIRINDPATALLIEETENRLRIASGLTP